jgi:phosphate/sulfate permease
VVGVGLGDGKNAVQWKMVLTIAGGWIVTVPVAALTSAGVFMLVWKLFDFHY